MPMNSGPMPESEALSALELMEGALQLLDRSKYGIEVAPHLDLAICRFRKIMSEDGLNLPARPSGEPKI